ncbi:MAG: CHASE3 domain-containing protein, partial [Sphingomonadaceae bacterium]|nr:CHASE3 domain-containing protein [Sphingomonadaceae bacterium]
MAAPADARNDDSLRLLGRQGQWPLALGFAVLVLVGAINVWLVRSSAEQNERVAHSFEVRATANRLLGYLQQAETGQRGYLLVGGDIYLGTHREGMAQTLPTFERLQRLTADNPSQQQRLREMRPLIERRLADLERAVELKAAGRDTESMALVRTNLGKRLMDDLRRRLGAFDAGEQRLLELRSQRAESGSMLLLAVTLAGLALILAIAVVAYRSVARYTRAIELTSAELQLLNTDLEGR